MDVTARHTPGVDGWGRGLVEVRVLQDEREARPSEPRCHVDGRAVRYGALECGCLALQGENASGNEPSPLCGSALYTRGQQYPCQENHCGHGQHGEIRPRRGEKCPRMGVAETVIALNNDQQDPCKGDDQRPLSEHQEKP